MQPFLHPREIFDILVVNFSERLAKELKGLAAAYKVEVHAPPERKYSVWHISCL